MFGNLTAGIERVGGDLGTGQAYVGAGPCEFGSVHPQVT